MKKEALVEICVALIVLLFAYTGVSKLLDYEKFVFQMGLAPLPLMRSIAPVLGILLPVMEVLIASALLTGRYRMWALYASAGLFLAFDLYIAGMMLSGSQLPCTCGGIISKMGLGQHLIFNIIFLLITLSAIRLTRKYKNSALQQAGL